MHHIHIYLYLNINFEFDFNKRKMALIPLLKIGVMNASKIQNFTPNNQDPSDNWNQIWNSNRTFAAKLKTVDEVVSDQARQTSRLYRYPHSKDWTTRDRVLALIRLEIVSLSLSLSQMRTRIRVLDADAKILCLSAALYISI